MKFTTTIFSLLLSLITLTIPIIILSTIYDSTAIVVAGGLFLVGVLLFNIYALLHGDRVANTFALIVSCIAIILAGIPVIKTFVLNLI